MRTRTFIGLIFLVFALIIASTPALLNPAASSLRSGLVAAGVPGLQNSAATRTIPPGTGQINNSLELKGYLAGKNDMQDQLPVGDRQRQFAGGRLVAGEDRALLPGETLNGDPNSPTIMTPGGVLLDGTKCPVFRAGVDIVTLWKDPTQKAKYLAKAAKATSPAACTALLSNRVLVASKSGTVDQVNARDMVNLINGDNLSVSITSDYDTLLNDLFPQTNLGTNASTIRAQQQASLNAALQQNP